MKEIRYAMLTGSVIISGFGLMSTSLAQDASSATLAKVRITAGSAIIHANVFDNATSRDFLARLPMTVVMTRNGEREYHGRPDIQISRDGPKQRRFENGDLGYWAPGGYLAIFLDNTIKPEINDLIVMGKVTSNLSHFRDLESSQEMVFDVVAP